MIQKPRLYLLNIAVFVTKITISVASVILMTKFCYKKVIYCWILHFQRNLLTWINVLFVYIFLIEKTLQSYLTNRFTSFVIRYLFKSDNFVLYLWDCYIYFWRKVLNLFLNLNFDFYFCLVKWHHWSKFSECSQIEEKSKCWNATQWR